MKSYDPCGLNQSSAHRTYAHKINIYKAGTSEANELAKLYRSGEPLYNVSRFCCTAGKCSKCGGRGRAGDLEKRKRLFVNEQPLTKREADETARHWKSWSAKAEPIF